MIILKNPQYMMEMGFGRDTWRLHGNVYNHPRFDDGNRMSPTNPISLEEYDQDIYKMTTYSGSIYLLEQPSDKVLEQIRKDIENKGYEGH